MVVRELYTVADLEALYALPENQDKRFELITGEIIETPTGTFLHGYIIGEVSAHFWLITRQYQLGYVFTDTVTYALSTHDEYIPDVSFIAAGRLTEFNITKFMGAPDLAVEVMSPSNDPETMLRKIERYLAFGTQQVWVIYPDEGFARIYRRESDGSMNVRRIEADGTLDGDNILPGFQLALSAIFPPHPASAE